MIDRDPRVVIAELAARIDKLEQTAAILPGSVYFPAWQRLQAEKERLRAALRQILEDPDARILDSHRDDGWAALR
jgi:hypothetical protein